MKKFEWIGKVFLATSAVVLIAAGCNSATKTEQTPEAPAAQQSEVSPDSISYEGQDGKTALELLKASHKVETENYAGVGEYVKSINGIVPSKDEFWGFYVNGESSNVGAGQYQSKSTDKIEWKLDTVGDYKE